MFEDRPLEDARLVRPLILRISLDDLANPSGTGPLYDYYYDPTLPTTSHTFTPVQGVIDSMDGMYWALHLSNNLMRVYEWSDSTPSSSVRSFDREVPAWTPLFRGQGECAGPDGNNWCARGQSKIRGAFMSNDVIGFFWDANEGGVSENNATFTYPYVDAATFNTANNMTYLGRPYLWSPIFAWMYGAGSPDSNGNVAMQAFFGGGDYYPSIAAGIGNDFSEQSSPWQINRLVNGTNGPAPTVFRPPSWGDYITIRPFNGEGPGWVGSGWALEGGPSARNVVPRYFEFTLQNDNSELPTTVQAALEKIRPQEQYNSIFSTKFFLD
jgi:hypothetical protein